MCLKNLSLNIDGTRGKSERSSKRGGLDGGKIRLWRAFHGGWGAEKFAFYSAGREESQNRYGFKSFECKTAFSALNSYVQSSHHLTVKKPYINDPRVPASAVWVLSNPPGTHVSPSILDSQGVVSALTSLLNIVIELWFLTVAGSIAKDCIIVRDCGFDSYVFFHCRALCFTWVKELASTAFVFSYFPHWVIAKWVNPPNAARLISSQLQTG